jgi:arginase family enzyme
MIAIVRAISASEKLVGCDLSELSPPWDVSGMTSKLAARLFLEVLCSSSRAQSRDQRSPLEA